MISNEHHPAGNKMSEEINRHLDSCVLVSKRREEHAMKHSHIHNPILPQHKLCESRKAWKSCENPPEKFGEAQWKPCGERIHDKGTLTPTLKAATIFMLIRKKGKLKCST